MRRSFSLPGAGADRSKRQSMAVPVSCGNRTGAERRREGGTPTLTITFGSIVGNAEHLAILGRTIAALAPRVNVVGVHFIELIDSAFFRVVPNRAERTVGLALGLGSLRLL